MLSSVGHLFLCLNGILSWNVSNLSFLMSLVFLSPIKNVKQLNENTLIEPIINSFFLCDMVKLKLFLQIWNWLRWTFSVGDLPRLASQKQAFRGRHFAKNSKMETRNNSFKVWHFNFNSLLALWSRKLFFQRSKSHLRVKVETGLKLTPWWWWSSESCKSQGKEQGVLASCPSPVSTGVCRRQCWGVRVIKRSSVIPELWLIVKVTVVDVLLPRTLIETLIREDDLNFDRYWETVYDSGHAPP